MVKLPVIIINLKKYDEVLGKKALVFSRIAKKLSDKYGVAIFVAPPFPLLGESAEIVSTLSQHVDPYETGAFTGSIVAKELKELGVAGSLINHSERRMPHSDIAKCVELCRKYMLISIVCVKDDAEAGELAKLKPDFIALEPPELIGGGISVSTARPEMIKHGVKSVKDVSAYTHVLCGAGIKNREDAKKAIELGTDGILIASGIVKAADAEGAVEELVAGILEASKQQ